MPPARQRFAESRSSAGIRNALAEFRPGVPRERHFSREFDCAASMPSTSTDATEDSLL